MNARETIFQTSKFGIAKSSLMVLEEKNLFLSQRIKRHKGLPKYLQYLIKNYGFRIRNEYPLKFRVTKKYQLKGREYTRIKFEIDGNTWIAYQLLAVYLRVSISYLLAILLSWDIKEKDNKTEEKNIVTNFFKEIKLNFNLLLETKNKYDYKCLLIFRL